MDSALLKGMGLGNLDIGIVLIVLIILLIAALTVAIMANVKIGKLTRKYNFFMRGKSAKSLEDEIIRMFEENTQMKIAIKDNSRDIKSIYKQLITTYQKMGMVKYDAFNQMGGKLSFCLALLNEDNSGFLLNSVHSTDSSYCYIKRIEAGLCKMDLSNEESLAIKKAINGEANETN